MTPALTIADAILRVNGLNPLLPTESQVRDSIAAAIDAERAASAERERAAFIAGQEASAKLCDCMETDFRLAASDTENNSEQERFVAHTIAETAARLAALIREYEPGLPPGKGPA